MINKYYLYATVTRSFDKYHMDNKIIHLMFSIFYSPFDRISYLIKQNKDRQIIIRISNWSIESFNVIEHNPLNIEFQIPIDFFIEYNEKNGFNNFIEKLIGNHISTEKNIDNILTNTIFVFENFTWTNIQNIFSLINIKISGGSISRRPLLSTNEYMLCYFLFKMLFTLDSIYQSKNYFKELSTGELDSESLYLDKNLLLTRLTTEYNEILYHLNIVITKVEGEIKSLNDSIKKMRLKLEQKKQKAVSSGTNDDFFIKEYINKINNTQKELETQSEQLSNLQKNADEIKTLLAQLKDLSLSQLKEIYYKEFHNHRLFFNKNKFNSYISKFQKKKPTKISYITGKRVYSTMSKCRSSRNNNLIFSNLSNNLLANKYSLAYDLGKAYDYRFQMPVKNLSIYTHDSNVTQNILKLIYTEDSKENIQYNIENYLITKQNNYLISQTSVNSSGKSTTNINYNIINYNIKLILLESKQDLMKLYNNYISNFTSKNQVLVKVLSTVEFDYLNNIIIGRLLRIITNNNRANSVTFFTEVAYDLGKDLINRYNYTVYLQFKFKFESFSQFKEQNSEKIINLDDPTLIVELGSVLIGWLIELKLVQTKIYIISAHEKRNILLVGEILNKVISKIEVNTPILNLPVKIPMLVPPKKYLNEDGSIAKHLGGYLLNDVLYTEPLFIENSSLVEKPELSNFNIIYKMVDNINSVSFAINQEVLDFILNNFKKYDLIIDPEFNHPLKIKSKLTIEEKRELESFHSHKTLEAEILNLAQIFRNSSEIFLPVRLDYRGRMYCIVEYLNYQGIELAKALLKFSKGEKVSLDDEFSINYLKIFGANCFGLDKKSFSDRIQWINENKENIINFDNGELISKAKSKLLFISFCFEYCNYLEALNNNETYFITHLPIQLDATCNGFQHLSLLLADTALASKVNLTKSSWIETPEDFYSFLALKCKDYFNSDLETNKKLNEAEKESYKRLSNMDFKSHRNLVKKTIMTIPYNSTMFANIQDMKADFRYDSGTFVYITDEKIKFKNNDFQILCKTLYICLYRDFPKLEALLKYFKDIAKIANKLGILIPWNLPTGLNVKQKYYGTKKVKFKPFIYTKDLLNINIYDKNKFNTRKQSRALMPNLVHSLDAASLALLIDSFFKEDKNRNFYSVHDCFAVTCNNVNLIVELLKLSYYKIYCTDNYLMKFDSDFKNSILTQFGNNCYSAETNTLNIINDEGENIKLKYPNINEVLKPEKLDFMGSSYFIG